MAEVDYESLDVERLERDCLAVLRWFGLYGSEADVGTLKRLGRLLDRAYPGPMSTPSEVREDYRLGSDAYRRYVRDV